MANITITIPDDKLNNVIEAFATQYDYKEKIIDVNGNEINNPVSKVQFAKNIVNSFIKEVFISAQVKNLNIQRQQIIQTANEDVSNITTN